MTDERLMKVLECCANDDCDNCPSLVKECKKHAMLNALDLINRQKAEIERLKKENHQFADIGKMYSEVRAEVIKEFADRLKDAFPEGNRDAKCPSIYYDDYCYIIDELAEEMTEGNSNG